MHPVGDQEATIAVEEARIAELERQLGSARRRLSELRGQGGHETPTHVSESDTRASARWSPERKLALFASLFRGREDVFPQRWVSRDRTKSGWAPRCANEWKAGVCGKPRVKCGECPNQAFVRPDQTQLRAHLEGRQVMAVYPLLADDTCRLLAIDLDGKSWPEDIGAIREACAEMGVVPAVERSRSGDGAHVWFFFNAPVPGALARGFGLGLLTNAMGRSRTLRMASYDRLFPSQDMLPKNGFGNLIALPLQREARERGNTVFLDERLEPYEDQWAFLDSLPRIGPDELEKLIAGSTRGAGALGLDEEGARAYKAPWRPALSLTHRLASAKLPESIDATLAQRIYIEADGLPAPLVDAIRRLATFRNPQFLERQGMRLSTARTPHVITCFEETGKFLALPRGCLEQLEALLDELNVGLALDDERVEGLELAGRFLGELTDVQGGAAKEMLGHELGVLCAPPGSGKTVIATELIAARGRSTLILVHRKPLLDQWRERLLQFLELECEPGTIGGGTNKPTGLLDIAMVQSLARRDGLAGLLAGYGHVIVDECHHVPAVTTERVLQEAGARYVTGLTATPQRRDGHHPIVTMQCGPIRARVAGQGVDADQRVEMRVVRRDTRFDPEVLPTGATIQEVFGALAGDDQRTRMIVDDALSLVREGRSPLILTERRVHLQQLRALLVDDVPGLIALHGEMSAPEAKAASRQFEELAEEEPCLVLATGRYIGEGFDEPRLDTLLLAMPVAWKGTVTQYAGRLHRAHAGKGEIRVYDYVDAEVPVLRRMFAKRLSAYRKLGYELVETA